MTRNVPPTQNALLIWSLTILTNRLRKAIASGLRDFSPKQSISEHLLQSLRDLQKVSDKIPNPRTTRNIFQNTFATSTLFSPRTLSMNCPEPNPGTTQLNSFQTLLRKVAKSTHLPLQNKRNWTPSSRRTSTLAGSDLPSPPWPRQSSLSRRRMVNSDWCKTIAH